MPNLNKVGNTGRNEQAAPPGKGAPPVFTSILSQTLSAKRSAS